MPTFYVAHQACAYGSQRPKWTVLASNCDIFRKICKTCPGESSSHKHLPWGLIKDKQGARFATSEETAYPFPLAAEIAICFAEELKNRGWKPPAETHSSDQVASLVKCRASTGIQPKSSRLPPLVRAAHKAILVIRGPSSILSQHRLNPMERTKVPLSIDPKCTTSSNFDQFPAESQHLRSTPMRSRGGLDCAKGHDGELASGIPYSPQEFVRAAVEAGHPHHIKNLIPKVLENAVWNNTNKSNHEICANRAALFKKWISRSRELHQQELSLKSRLSPDVSKILEQKKILLWKEMLESSGYPDMGVVDEVIGGTELLGEVGVTGIFGSKFKPADITIDELKHALAEDRLSICYSARSSGDEEIDMAVLEKTQEEVDNGWAIGPLELDQLPPEAVLSRRFGLKQPGKVRLIDDLSGSLIISTVQTNESPKPHTTDVIAALSLELLRSGNKNILGRAYDLQPAYKRLAINPSSMWASFIVIFSPQKRKPEFYQLKAVPFGATRAVFSFLRVAHSIWHLGASQLDLMWTNFYDDFIVFSKADGCEEHSFRR